jgi:hypothetical protein
MVRSPDLEAMHTLLSLIGICGVMAYARYVESLLFGVRLMSTGGQSGSVGCPSLRMRNARFSVLVAGLAVVLTILTSACNRSEADRPALPTPSAPTPLPAAITSYAGAWHGTFTITECRGRRHCNESIGQQSPFSLLLQQSGSRVDGVFQAEDFATPVDGQVSVEGGLTLTGGRASAGWYLPAVELTRFTARRSDTAGLVAELGYRLEYPDGTPPTVNSLQQAIGGNIVSAALGPPTSRNSFAGRWIGKLLITDCSAVGWTSCYPESRGEQWGYELTLAQTGDRVSGELRMRQRIAVTGTVSGDTLTLDAATKDEPVSSATVFWHLRNWTMTKDAVGQVRGGMAYDNETVWIASLNQSPFVSRYRADILYGILER